MEKEANERRLIGIARVFGRHSVSELEDLAIASDFKAEGGSHIASASDPNTYSRVR
jgi:hypothetical protein